MIDERSIASVICAERQESVKRKRISLSQLVKYLGPAFIVSVAYIDPGNFATNISGGSSYGYSLLWVILWSNLVAIFLQIMSAKLGIATGKNLPQMCRLAFPKTMNRMLYAVAMMAAMATTMAEFIGGVLGFRLLFGMRVSHAAVLTVAVTFTIIYAQKYGQRLVEMIIFFFIVVICAAYVIALFLSGPDWGMAAVHTLIPSLPDRQALLIVAGMLGATVMPHVIFLHSQLVQSRNDNKTPSHKKRHLKLEKMDIIIAMNIAFLVNAAMVVVSAAAFHSRGIEIDSIEAAHRSLEPLLGSLSSGAFGIALLASGFSSSSVGAMAGETVMDGFVNFKLPLWIRRVLTMLPGLIVILSGVDPMKALVLSQVSLSFALPAAIIPMLIITSSKKCMGIFMNKPWVTVAGWMIAVGIILLNGCLVLLTLQGIRQ